MAALNATLRPLAASDSLEALTALLHRAYAWLGEMGLNFTAVDQSVETTKRRVESGQCFVAEIGQQLAGTVTVCDAYDPNTEPWARATPWFYRRDVAHLHQLGVDPSARGQGLGDQLVAAGEQWARDRGRGAIALDTAAPAAHLRQRYARLGYRDVDEVQWAGKTYRSVLMVAALADGRVHSVIEITQGGQRFFANSIFFFVGGMIARVEEYWATVETAPAWRTAAAIGAYQRTEASA
ncbi:MAG: GNAT family N-acetyltransferase [Burkholderiaceae bacterium]|nr:GNAT family N-acetyltransferase [Burkholderiaceae bacterium]